MTLVLVLLAAVMWAATLYMARGREWGTALFAGACAVALTATAAGLVPS